MAQYDMTETVARGEAAGITYAELEQRFGARGNFKMVGRCPTAWNQSTRYAVIDYVEAAEARAMRAPVAAQSARGVQTAPTDAPRATPRQVDLIMTLLASRTRSGEGGGFFAGPTDRGAVSTLTRAQASAYIDSLKGAY